MSVVSVTVPQLREAIATTIAERSAHEVADLCVALGLDPHQGDDDSPWHSKYKYVARKLFGKSMTELVDLARRVAEEYNPVYVQPLLDQLGARGAHGELKNLIFAANGPKPHIVLRDAIDNVIEIVKNAEHCLVYDKPLTEHGLTWREFITWWSNKTGASGDERHSALALYTRLCESLANEIEIKLFRAYCQLYARPDGFDLPALIPQVYLHYDPYSQRRLGNQPDPLARQRMDFLLLLPRNNRVVIEIDGRQHYADDQGLADPARYAAMATEDRELRLGGYEVYRFGAHQLTQPGALVTLRTFFDRLLSRHGLPAEPGPSPT